MKNIYKILKTHLPHGYAAIIKERYEASGLSTDENYIYQVRSGHRNNEAIMDLLLTLAEETKNSRAMESARLKALTQ
jgi:hypothetical protein